MKGDEVDDAREGVILGAGRPPPQRGLASATGATQPARANSRQQE
jgi:hypothetical protein